MAADSNEIHFFVKDFFDSCFHYLKKPNRTIEDQIHNEDFIEIKQKLLVLVDRYTTFCHEHPKDVFFLLINRSIREICGNWISNDINTNSQLLDGITADGELDYLFVNLAKSIDDIVFRSKVSYFLSRCLSEIYQFISEYERLQVLIYNRNLMEIEAVRKQDEEVLNRQTSLINNFELSTIKACEKFEKAAADYDNKARNIENNFLFLAQNLKNTEKKMTESNLTILGIFSAIVLTFNATIGFYTSTIEAFSHASSYKVLLILLLVGFISVNALMGLFYYLGKIRENQTLSRFIGSMKEKTKSELAKPKISLKSRKSIKPLLPFIITNLLIILLMSVVFFSWLGGVIEHRNSKLSQELVIESAAFSGKNIQNE